MFFVTQMELFLVRSAFADRKAVNCPAIDGIIKIIKEAKEVAGDVPVENKAALDATLIAAAQAASIMR
jgi:ferritin-like metal-binding protein YciE